MGFGKTSVCYRCERFLYICYVPVMERKILSVEINDSNNNVESNIYEGDILNKNDEKIIKRWFSFFLFIFNWHHNK